MDDCRTQNTNYKYRSGPLSSFTVVTPHFILPKLLRGTQNQWVAHVSFVIIYSTGLTPFPWLSAPPHLSHSHLMGSGTLERCFLHGWMVAVGLWYGQAYITDNEHRCILLMAFWMHRDTVTRSWGPLLCHSSTTITSCCSMIMHGPMLQGSVHNSWELKIIPVLAWPAYSPDMSPIEHVWDALDRRICQLVPVPAKIHQLRTANEEEWTNIPQATINNLINSNTDH